MPIRYFQQYKCRAWYFSLLVLAIMLALVFSVGSAPFVSAQDVSGLRDQISERSERIKELEREIQQYEADLQEVGAEKQTLQGAVNSLDISRQKIGSDIKLTENRIGSSNLGIQQLALEIAEKELAIAKHQEAIAKSLRSINEFDGDSLVEAVLAHADLNEVWERIETLERFQLAVREDVRELTGLRNDLTEDKLESEGKKQELLAFRNQLSGQKRVLDVNREEKDKLLTATKNEEASYQRLLEEKRAAREQFERELLDLETQLEFALDPSSIPAGGKGILGWPLEAIRITQYFGNTQFARSGAYNGQGHNGVDFGASSGTRVRAALGGTVVGSGNTDEVRGCYSYGKWILIQHNNGLSTLYAHLSVINVSPGQQVTTSEVIGFSGNTGYSTGPHLHFSVYASEAVKVVRLGDVKAITNCAAARIPIAPLQAYLNPLDYLPTE
jgi:murein DD-endopeptidase MepM/ murein hydrolase activator NlpD